MTVPPERGLHFSFADLYKEIESLSQIAKNFLAPGAAEVVLPRLRRELESVQTNGNPQQTTPWQISMERPLRTTISRGAYARQSQGELNIYAALSFIWAIAPVRAVRGQPTHFTLDGLGSTRVTLHHACDANPFSLEDPALAAWTLDVGSHDGPGTHFHVQLHHAYQSPVLPKTLDVPRLPALPMSPLLTFEAILAELFQDEWEAEAARSGGAFQTWNQVQRQRLTAFFKWQQEAFDAKRGATPWVVLKGIKPKAKDLLR